MSSPPMGDADGPPDQDELDAWSVGDGTYESLTGFDEIDVDVPVPPGFPELTSFYVVVTMAEPDAPFLAPEPAPLRVKVVRAIDRWLRLRGRLVPDEHLQAPPAVERAVSEAFLADLDREAVAELVEGAEATLGDSICPEDAVRKAKKLPVGTCLLNARDDRSGFEAGFGYYGNFHAGTEVDTTRRIVTGRGSGESSDGTGESGDTDPSIWGPLGGPAPQRRVERATLFQGAAVARDVGEELPVTLQPWCFGGATYVAWRIGDDRRFRGVLDEEAGVLRLGVAGYPEGDGAYRTHVTLPTEASETLLDDVHYLYASFQSPSMSAKSVPVPDEHHPRPAPPEAAASGEVHAFEVNGYHIETTGFVQPWRPANAGAVYVACRFDDLYERYGVANDWYVRFGQHKSFIPFFAHPHWADDFDDLVADVRSLVDGAPRPGFELTVLDAVVER